ncbi:MAG TPA: GNAT family N-acetyltransferase [Sulfurimonas sp. UBA12504]|nr:MAG: hypothetical protein A2019_08475 [Sulfurimonas sp. GWF2_37_8]DAB30187.1 MAG TPA: GNAT family N-acetyltransferase [Sulfurimonas sp. UBA12504]
MQIRELDLKELDKAYLVVRQLRDKVSYEEFEDLIYDMKHTKYQMFGIFERENLVTFAGVSVNTTLQHKRHLCVYDFIVDENEKMKGYSEMMLEYIEDYAKICMCENILFLGEFTQGKLSNSENSVFCVKRISASI